VERKSNWKGEGGGSRLLRGAWDDGVQGGMHKKEKAVKGARGGIGAKGGNFPTCQRASRILGNTKRLKRRKTKGMNWGEKPKKT